MISVHAYQLSEKRRGALLRVEGKEGVGYADLHTWPELGDLSLEESLAGRGPLLERSLKLAAIDAAHRAKGIPVDLSEAPKSHFLLADLQQLGRAIEEGFTTVKFKVSSLSDGLLDAIQSTPIQWRLDANGRLTKREVEQFYSRCHALEKIEFFEDPYPCAEGWTRGMVPLAYDRGPEPSHFDIRIIKPALHLWEKVPKTHPVVVTSYLGHPLGQVADAYVAAAIGRGREGGLLSHRIYPKNRFSERLSWRGPQMIHPGGTGFGFDDLLKNLEWKKR